MALPNNSAKTIVSFVIMLFYMSALLVFSFPKTLFFILFWYSIACPTLSNGYFLLHYCISLYSASSIWLHLFLLFFFSLFTLYVLFLPKDRNYLPQHVHLIRVHTLCMNYGHLIIIFVFIYICEQFVTYLNITLLFFCCLLIYVYSAIFITADFCHYGQICCANRCKDCCICIHKKYYSNCCNMLLTASYLISLLAHAIYPTYLVKLCVLSNVYLISTHSPIVQLSTEPSHMLLVVVPVIHCGIDRVLPVLRPVCVTHSCPLACMCVCVGAWTACGACARLRRASAIILHQSKWHLTNFF